MAGLFVTLVPVFPLTAAAAGAAGTTGAVTGLPAPVDAEGNVGDEAEDIRNLERSIASGEIPKAKSRLEALVNATAEISDGQRAPRLFRYAGYAVDIREPGVAERLYGQAAEAFGRSGARTDSAIAAVNALQAKLDNADFVGLARLIDSAEERVAALDRGSERSGLLLRVGYLLLRSVVELQEPASRLDAAKELFRQVLFESGEREHILIAHLLTGRCLELAGRSAPALRSTSKALFIAQEMQADQYVYQAEWQLGRILRATGSPDSEAAYRRAIAALAKVKSRLLASSTGVFRTQIAPVYREYADLLLSNAARQPAARQREMLRDVVAVLERLKQSEVEDYYSRECVAVRSLGGGISLKYGASAIVYPIILDDRVEVISEVGGEIIHHTAPISRVAITELIRSLRVDLERPLTEDAYLPKSQKLYELILSHLEEPLARSKVNTLVLVPDGPLRTIPPAVLHDGRQHLVERMSIVIQPAMSLLPDDMEHGENRMVAGGISKKVEGFARLPAVGEELRRLPAINSGRILENEQFTIESIREALSDQTFSTAHLATHGEFNEDFRRTFILTWDGRLSVNRLQSMLQARPGDRPLELLVLSACQTAAGDDRAALGLAGIAVQSGARSALASLWSISDTATAELMADFYDGLFSGGLGKAESLRKAQLKLMRSSRYRHPSYWAPYVLTGEWR